MNMGQVVRLRIESKLLKGNPLGDPSVRDLYVYLPPGYDGSSRRFPVIYCLSGFGGNGRGFLNSSPFAPSLPERMDKLIPRGCPEVILVFPDCFTRVGGSQYVDSTATGPYQRHLLEEVIPFVDRELRTLPEGAHRGVMGKSSGGYGAIILGMQFPELFAAVASHSGDMYFDYCYRQELPDFCNGFWRHGSIRRFLDYFDAQPSKRSSDFQVYNMIGMAAAYSPNPQNPDLGIDLPVELETGELREDVWARWMQHDPVHLVEKYADNLRKLRGLFFDCGLRDEYALHIGARILASRLRKQGISHTHSEFDDTHGSTSYRYELSVPSMARLLTEGV